MVEKVDITASLGVTNVVSRVSTKHESQLLRIFPICADKTIFMGKCSRKWPISGREGHIMANVKRKINTLLHNPSGVKRKYEMILRFLVRRAPVPIYHEDYNAHWKYFSFKDKTILDLGADYGSTAYFFGKNGASKVIAVEGDKTFFNKLQKYALKYKYIIPIELMIKSEEDIMRLIFNYSPDIVKVDIEGAERLLIDSSEDCLNMVDEWLIETHEPSLSEKLVKKFCDSGFSVRKIRQSEVHDILVIEKRSEN
jgi:hypothetical protein